MLGDEVGFKTQIDGIGITDTRLMTKDHWRIQEQVPEHRESIGMCQDGEDLIKNPRYAVAMDTYINMGENYADIYI